MAIQKVAWIAVAACLAGCGGTEAQRRDNIELQRQNIDERFQGGESFSDLFGSSGDPDRQINVNRHLWAASLDVLSFLPIEAADPFSGLIVTGWGRVQGNGTPYRATVYIQDPALDARSLRVALFRNSGGRAIPVSGEVATRIEDSILNRAREIRIAASGRN